MGRRMGLDFGLESKKLCMIRKFRWLFIIPDISAEGVNALPPQKSARPKISFKEAEVQHLNEIVYYPMKPEWKTIPLSLYDVKKKKHPVFDWLQKQYDPCKGSWIPPVPWGFKKPFAHLEMYDGCGEIMERWTFENIYPQEIEFGDLDMSSSEYLTCDLSLRFDRVYIEDQCSS
jgi:hypothetical protein